MYLQRGYPDPDEHKLFAMKSMVGGLNNTDYTPRDNEAVLIKNMSFSDGDAMEKRKGTKYYNESEYPEPIEFIDHFEPYTDEKIKITSTRYKLYADGVEIANAPNTVQGTNYSGMYLFVDGERFKAYGSFEQTEGDYVKIIGTPTEDYMVMNIVDAPTGYIPLDKEHLVGRTVYDYTNRQIWYEPNEFQQEDPYMGFSVVPINTKYMVTHNSRLFVSGNAEDDDNVYISDIQSPFYFPVSLPLQPTPNSDKITKLIVFNDSVIIGRHNDVYAITGNSNNPEITDDLFRLRRLNTHTGFMNSTSANIVHNYLFFFGNDGEFYAMSSINQSDHLLLTTVLSKTLDMFREPLGFSKEDLLKATTIFYENEWYVSFGDKLLLYSYTHKAWTVYEGFDATYFNIINFDLVWGTSQGRLVSYADDYLDLDEPFECRIETKSFDMGSPMLYKYFREFAVVAHTFNDYASDIRISFDIDYQRVNHISKIKNQMSRWGISLWGDRFINNNISMSNPLPVHRRGRYIKFIFANGWDVQEHVFSLGDLENIRDKRTEETLVWVELEGLFYLYTLEREWVPLTDFQENQAMKIYEINGDYTLRSKR